MKNNSLFLSNLHYFYAQTDGTYAIPNSAEGDLLKTAKREIEALEQSRQDINKLLDKVVELEKENYRLNQLINGKNARRSMEEHISNEIVDGTYDPWPTDFDYETDFHHKLSTLMKQVDKLRQENSELKAYADKLVDGLPCLPKDIEVLRYANHAFANENDSLKAENDQLKADFVNITGRYMKENAELKALLNQIRNEPKLWKAGRAGRQDQYAGKPPFVPMIDAIMKQHLNEGGTPT